MMNTLQSAKVQPFNTASRRPVQFSQHKYGHARKPLQACNLKLVKGTKYAKRMEPGSFVIKAYSSEFGVMENSEAKIGSSSSKLYTNKLMRASSIPEVIKIAEECGELMDYIHVGTMANKLRSALRKVTSNTLPSAIEAYKMLVPYVNEFKDEFDDHGIVSVMASLACASEEWGMEEQIPEIRPTFMELYTRIQPKFDTITGRDTQKLLIALNKMNLKNPDDINILMDISTKYILSHENLSTLDIIYSLESLASYKPVKPEYVEALLNRFKAQFDDAREAQIPKMFQTMIDIPYYDAPFLRQIENYVRSGNSQLQPHNIIKILYGIANCKTEVDSELKERLFERFQYKQKQFATPEEYSYYLYTCAYLKIPVQYIPQRCLQTAQKKLQMPDSAFFRLRQAQLLYKQQGEQLVYEYDETGVFQQKVLEGFQTHRESQKSELQDFKNDVCEFVGQLYGDAQANLVDEQSEQLVDVAIVNVKKVALVLIGPDQAMINFPEMLTIDPKVVIKLLEYANWNVLLVYQNEWYGENGEDYKQSVMNKIEGI
eukprot:TRINITY_DN20195_c0_g1_i6.p2 TRINITY_DN20195_c0_g1~~TRINITY_DN20195_c0_g1_i6.p2  ORF type:complete len:568 (+),score=64.22 TRINITY_DN20195_c0_g1_i6:73-1704(+)